MAENTCLNRRQNIAEGPQARVLFLGGADMPESENALSFDAELKRYAGEHDYRCGALVSCAAADWLQERDMGLVSLPGMTLQELFAAREALTPAVGIGVGENGALANRPGVVAVNGVRLGVLSLSETTENGGDGRAAEADIEDLAVYDHVRMLLPQCDHVVVICRAGLPGVGLPLPEWRERFRRLIEAGASAVLDVRSDEPMGWEEYGRGVVFYGLGRLTGDSLAVSITFERNGRFTYESRLLEAGADTIGFSADDAKKEAVNAKNALLADETRYLDAVERACTAYCRAEGYETLFASVSNRGGFSGFLRKIRKDDRQDGEAMLKSILAETSRRSAVLRALDAKERTKAGDEK